jgi:hypothetical protein
MIFLGPAPPVLPVPLLHLVVLYAADRESGAPHPPLCQRGGDGGGWWWGCSPEPAIFCLCKCGSIRGGNVTSRMT